ncbi:MAG TPA: protein arginine kinase [bacterium]|nr:protein arginine kinase [bacterium]HOL47990.1 protein arginine kinase [bacterium]HPQ18588.1 protein arginine kinase [bacterium]
MNIIEELIKTPEKWLDGKGPYSDIVISSRIRLARNLANFPFPNQATKEELNNIKNLVETKIKKIKSFKDLFVIKLNEIEEIDKHILIERHLMSHDMLEKPDGMVIVNEEEEVSILVNEEDHLRLQVLTSGLQLKKCWKIINELDDAIEKEMQYAFSSEYGYLTSCPTNVGTGLRASVLVHLPGLVLSKHINQVLKSLANIGIAVRGYYGEGTEVIGNFYQISNQLTLGKEENTIIDDLEKIIKKIIENELQSREILYNELKIDLEDQIFRAYGILKNARIISSKEATELLSTLKLGIDLKLIKDIETSVLNELLIFTQPSHLQKKKKKLMEAKARDIERAQIIRQRLA